MICELCMAGSQKYVLQNYSRIYYILGKGTLDRKPRLACWKFQNQIGTLMWTLCVIALQ